MSKSEYIKISGKVGEKRIPSRVLEEMIHQHVKDGHTRLEIEGFGQHGIGGRLWNADSNNQISIRITGQSGQRTGSLGNANTNIEIMGPASDDIGWLNAGAQIVVHGHASNGVMNGAAQGKVFVSGSIGARGMTMTKHNPRFEPPELWVLGTAGDYFGEFMAGGIAVVLGHNASSAAEILGHRPLVGMVGGSVFVHGKVTDFSQKDAKEVAISNEKWEWLMENLTGFLNKINQGDLLPNFANRTQWQLLQARTPQEKANGTDQLSMSDFRDNVWEKELGRGGLIGDLMEVEKESIPVITKADYRRYVPVWEQGTYIAPCQAACPTGIPVQKRWDMVRMDNIDEAISMGLEYTPFPATVCGYLCPSPCMASCTRNAHYMVPIDVKLLGRAGQDVKLPKPEAMNGHKVAVIGAGPAGISAAWHLVMKGYQPTVLDTDSSIGGKISSLIPGTRIPKETLEAELERIKVMIPDIQLNQTIDSDTVSQIEKEYDFTIIAAGAKKPRSLPVPGVHLAVLGNDFLEQSKKDKTAPGKNVVIIGAGNVGCDIATEAYRLGAQDITMIDVQKPAAFGKEKEDAQAIGAKFRWPCFTKKITKKGVELEDGELIPADTVVISIGDVPDLEFLGGTVELERGFVKVDPFFQTSLKNVFAIGDVVKPGLITDAIGSGKKAAENIDALIKGDPLEQKDIIFPIDKKRVSLEYYHPLNAADTIDGCGSDCASCGQCRDCGICEAICPEGAIKRKEVDENTFEYLSDPGLCIGCGFCKGACPCGIWDLIPNAPM